MNIENSHLSHIVISILCKERLMHLPFDFIFELWDLLDVNAVAGHGAVLAALLLTSFKHL